MRTKDEVIDALLRIQRQSCGLPSGPEHRNLCEHIEETLRWMLGEENVVSVLAGTVRISRTNYEPGNN